MPRRFLDKLLARFNRHRRDARRRMSDGYVESQLKIARDIETQFDGNKS